jgi:hypothetical protein
MEKLQKLIFKFNIFFYYLLTYSDLKFASDLCFCTIFEMASQDALMPYMKIDIDNVDTLVATTQGTINTIDTHGSKILGALIGTLNALQSNTITTMKALKPWLKGIVQIRTMQMIGYECAGKDALVGKFIDASALVVAMSKVHDNIFYKGLLGTVTSLSDETSLAEVQAKTAEYIPQVQELLESYEQYVVAIKHKAIQNHRHHLRELRSNTPQLRIAQSADIAEIPVSAKPCHFFRKNTCRNGSDCRFAHVPRNDRNGRTGARPAPAAAAAAPTAVVAFNASADQFVPVLACNVELAQRQTANRQ